LSPAHSPKRKHNEERITLTTGKVTDPVDDDAARERQQREGDARRERNVRP